MAVTSFRFGQFAPDRVPTGTDIVITCENLIPMVRGYRPVKEGVTLNSSAVPSRVLGAGSFRGLDGVSYLVAGTGTNLYRYQGGAWNSIGSGFTARQDHYWNFAQFGSAAIATNGVDAPQSISLSASSRVSTLSDSAPKMRYVAVVKEYVVAGVLDGDALQWGWSGRNDQTVWTPGTKQSGRGYLARGGAITGLVGGDYGLLFQESSISLLEAGVANTVFRRTEISTEIGCNAPRSIARWGQRVFFWSSSGPAMIVGAGEPQLIGDQRVTNTIAAASKPEFLWRMSAAIDPVNQIVAWSIPSVDLPDTIYVYHWGLDRWSTITHDAGLLLSGYAAEMSVEEVYSLLTASSTTMDTTTSTVDSLQWAGGAPALYVFNDTNNLQTFTGPNKAVSIATGDFELNPMQRTRVRLLRPDTDATTGVGWEIMTRARSGDVPTTTTLSDINAQGDTPCLISGRYFSIGYTSEAEAPSTYIDGCIVTHDAAGRY